MTSLPQTEEDAWRDALALRRISRSIIYHADLECFRKVMLFLVKDCCNGRPDVCEHLLADLLPCCPPMEKSHV